MKTQSVYIKKNKGQALAELAIFGSLILMCLSMLITYAVRFDNQQAVKMDAFRKAIQKAYDLNSSVTYTVKKDVHFPNIFGGFGQGQPSSMSSSANVMWTKGLPGPQGVHGDEHGQYSFYNINGEEIPLPRARKTARPPTDPSGGSDYDITVPYSVYKEETVRTQSYAADSIKQENLGNITTRQKSNLTDTTTTKIYTRFDKSLSDPNAVPEPVYVYNTTPETRQAGAYYNATTNRIEYRFDKVGNIIYSERFWQTNE